MLHCVDSAADDVAVFADERHDIRQRSDGGKLRIALDDRGAFALDGADELQSDADARQLLVGVRAVRLLCVDDRNCGGERLLPALVVVGDDDIDADLFCMLHLRRCGDAAVDAYDEAHALRFELVDRSTV